MITELAIPLLLALDFAVGVGAGMTLERRRRMIPDPAAPAEAEAPRLERRPRRRPLRSRIADRARDVYGRYAPLLLILIALTAGVGVWIGSGAALGTSRVVSCLEDHAEANASSSSEIRDASTLLTQRQKRSARALQEALIAPENSAEQRRLFIKFVGANGRLVAAYRNLEAVREANPVIPDPATYCDL